MRALWLILACAVPAQALAGDFLPGGNTAALARAFALPELGQPRILSGARQESRVLLEVTNEFVADGDCADECVLLDGETARLLLSYRRGLGGGWDFTADVPLLAQGGGFLDGWIEDWHDAFGLPDGGRPGQPRGQYRYRHAQAGVDRMDITEPYSGFGDITAGIGYALGADAVVRSMIKLPSGDGRRLGGGTAGAALWLETALPLPAGFAGFAAAGTSASARGEALPDMQKRQAYFGGVGMSAPLPFTTSVRLLAQLYAHSALYRDSALPVFARAALPLTLGLQLKTGDRARLDLGFQEDLAVYASPDFTVYLALTLAP